MGSGLAEIDIAGSAEDVWKLAGDFGGIGDWMPGIESCRVEGEDRILSTMGMTITERLINKDDSAKTITYSVIDGASLESHEATISVTGSGDTTHVTWAVDAKPDQMAEIMAGVYQQALEAIKAKIEG
jgi:carbon monoxide dehydrogenase subunit G